MRCPLNPDRRKARRGMVVVMVLLCLVVLLGAAAISLDGGGLLMERRHAQETADAAALAAAADLFQHYPVNSGLDAGGSAKQSAVTTATANGYTDDGGTTTTVTVNLPGDKYKGGPYKGNTLPAGYVEVTVQYNVPAGFSATAFGSGSTAVGARAVARGKWIPTNPQIVVFDLTVAASLAVVNNTGSISVNSGPVVVNSSSATAAGNPTNVSFTAPEFDVTGGMSGSFTGTKKLGSRPIPDPLSYLPAPDTTKLTTISNSTLNYSDTNPPPAAGLNPGVYNGGIRVTGGVSLTLNPGVYYMKGGGFSFFSTGNLTGSGVMIYNDPSLSTDVVNIAGAVPLFGNTAPGTITLSPITSGPWRAYQGLIIFQRQTATQTVYLTGNGNYNVTGTIYAANGAIQITTKSYQTRTDVMGSQYMSRTISLLGNSNLSLTQLPQTTMQRVINLVE